LAFATGQLLIARQSQAFRLRQNEAKDDLELQGDWDAEKDDAKLQVDLGTEKEKSNLVLHSKEMHCPGRSGLHCEEITEMRKIVLQGAKPNDLGSQTWCHIRKRCIVQVDRVFIAKKKKR